MTVLKKALLAGSSLFLVYYSWDLLSGIHSLTMELAWWEQVFWGYFLALSVTGIFAFAGFAFPTHRLLPGDYYRVDDGERLSWLYRVTGAVWMRRLLVATYWRWSANRKRYFTGRRSDLDRFDFNTRQSEFGHLASFVILLPVCLDLFVIGERLMAAAALLANWVGNYYPIVIQRSHRLRIQNIAERL